MIEDLHIVKEKAAFRIEHVGFDCSKVCRWDPDLLCDDEEVNETALDVADDDKDKNNEQPL